ncbi:hypothetical protein LBMAG54_09270 [Nitrosopumilaceae archaeon]|mgnify:CR=1 FL=1|nr:hypothetical protein EMGBD3_13850 [Nitrosarchaeum sp.]GDY16071.1 hypothetical protein LBMAG54_09270 [Nitrosopumilaceae archaeon]
MGFFDRFKTSKNDSDDNSDDELGTNCTTMIDHEEEYKKQMIKLKEDHDKMKGDEGDSDLIFNGKDNKYKNN